jgi:hypothetical protein
MASAPPPPTGWNPKDIVPSTQQQAQDTLVDYLRRTLAALPPGTVLDSAGYAGFGHNIGCEDEPKDSGALSDDWQRHRAWRGGPEHHRRQGRQYMAELGLVRLRTRRIHQAQPVRLRTRRVPATNRSVEPAHLPADPARLDTVLPRRHRQRRRRLPLQVDCGRLRLASSMWSVSHHACSGAFPHFLWFGELTRAAHLRRGLRHDAGLSALGIAAHGEHHDVDGRDAECRRERHPASAAGANHREQDGGAQTGQPDPLAA